MNALTLPPSPLAGPDPATTPRDAMALAALARDCVNSGVERRVLHVRLSLIPNRLREPRHDRLVREALEPLLRPTRARLYELPGGDLVALSPPPGDHLEEARRGLARLLPEIPAETLLPVMRLPAEAARLLTVVEAALGLDDPGEEPPAPAPSGLPPPGAAEMDAATRALATANLAAFLRRQTIWRLAPGDARPQPLWTELRPCLPDLAAALLPGRDVSAAPWLARRFRVAAERRMLAELARPQEARALGDACLPLSLASLLETEFLRLEALLGPAGRGRVLLGVPAADQLADPAGFALLRRLAAARGWALALDEAEPELLRLFRPEALQGLQLRLRFTPSLLAGDGTARTRLDAALPAGREGVVLTGADSPAAIAWGWQRGIIRFMGRVLDGR
ncbi:hypothetical protein KTR66_19750 [Roseococcus sp. SDR]|uniref:hypothetical protein n=1 Tax=Roseococcus sp. SDR TaxID=2835532 RepID=UPI001BCECA65|nr:hypothetical protein [Roseococcus sp. SDR]MBS7792243.1 hypothetical protein [Roseococcus sp. SDR]MBV1847557.1 hypothetical protein [Roseococcus sp. SDR]